VTSTFSSDAHMDYISSAQTTMNAGMTLRSKESSNSKSGRSFYPYRSLEDWGSSRASSVSTSLRGIGRRERRREKFCD
jgi:hypothetical protein